MTVKLYKLDNGNLMRMRKNALPQHLYSAWQDKRHLLRGDLSTIQKARFNSFTVHLCPWRASRPLPTANLTANIREPHKPCVFDRQTVIDKEGIAAFDVNGRLYYVLININPVNDPSFVLSKAPNIEPEQLNQIIHSPDDIADSIAMHQLFPPKLSFLFNSNPAGNTDAGATINHFHLQSFCFENPAGALAIQSGSMRVFEEGNIYTYLKILEENNNAYNLLFLRSDTGLTRVVVIPRSLGIPSTPFHGVAPTETVGAPFYAGFLSISNQLLFNALQEHPREAEQLLMQWQIETSVSPERLAGFDQAYEIEARMREEGIGFVLEVLPAGLLNQLISLRLDLSESQNRVLLLKSKGAVSVSVFDVLERLNITDHMLGLYKSLNLFRNARESHKKGTLETQLKGRGDPASVGEEGLIPSIPIILELSDIINRLLEDKEVEAVFYAAIFLHDLGKFISQTVHGENGFALIRDNPKIKEALAKVFNPKQIALISTLVRYHSIFTDTMVIKEPDILRPYRAVLANPKDGQLLINDLLYVMGIIDTDAYFPDESRLANDRLADLQELRSRIHNSASEGKTIEDLEINAGEAHLSWGKTRFNSWVVGETDLKNGTAAESLQAAQEELERTIPSPSQREDFFAALGSARHVGLIFDLRKELLSPELRTRLLIWFADQVKKYGRALYEFRIHREKGKWLGPEVDLMNKLLSDPSWRQKLDETLSVERKPDGAIEIIIPT